ncbi:MAG TPA: imidazolonepropionase [Nitrospiraceae bacterium]|nr:imidazolonepropionase [Nitrospiraceae bacterium]
MPIQEKPLLIDNCGQLLTLQGEPGPRRRREMGKLRSIQNGAVLIRNGMISSIGPAHRVRKDPQARHATTLDAKGRVVMPGFVDSHTHALFAGSRVGEYVLRIQGATYEDIAKAGGGIQASAKRMRAARLPGLVKQLQQTAQQFLEYGTTTIEAKSGYGLEFSQELKILQAIRVAASRFDLEMVATLLLHDVPPRLTTRRPEFLRCVVRELIPYVAREGLAEFCDVFCDRGYFSVSETAQLLKAASRAGLALKCHSEQLTHSGSASLAAGLGAVSVDHLDHVKAADIERMNTSGTIATLLPGTNLHLGATRYPPARQLIDGGVPVALATNFNPGSSPTLNMQLILSLACSYMHMSPAEAIVAATINGAHAVKRGNRVGSLEVGKQGDLVMMDVSDYREIPYFFGMNHCLHVVKKGRIVWSKGHHGTDR